MDYVSYPATTAYYMERALGKNHNVVTCGSVITSEVKKLWNLENLNWPINGQDIFRNNTASLCWQQKFKIVFRKHIFDNISNYKNFFGNHEINYPIL